jgi:hypothetical protein
MTKAESDSLFQHLESRILGFDSLHTFQLLVCMNDRSIVPPSSIVNDLHETLLGDVSRLSLDELLKGMELLGGLQGYDWDPEKVFFEPSVVQKLAQIKKPNDLIRLCNLGVYLDSTPEEPLSPLQASKLAMYLNMPSLIQHPFNSATLPYYLATCAAWSHSLVDNFEQSLLRSLSPDQAQLSVWSLLACGCSSSSPAVEKLWKQASLGMWTNLAMKHQCMQKMDPDYVPPYPIRIPQFASNRRRNRISEEIASLPSTLSVRQNARVNNHLIDIEIDGSRLIQICTVPRDPFFQIHSRFINAEIVS